MADAVVRGESAESLLDAAPRGGGESVVQRKAVNTTTTPKGLPDTAPPTSIRLPVGEAHVDGEGNEIIEDGRPLAPERAT